MLQQYLSIKEQHLDAILFFRLGDFYEMFFEDAKKASSILDIVLTSREGGKGNRVPMCGIPYHAAQSYINRLTREGLKVAICEQVEDPKAGTGIVKREVVRVITPGTNIDENVSDDQGENFIAGVYEDNGVIGLAYLNLGTGTFRLIEVCSHEDFYGEFARISPKECIIPSDTENSSDLYHVIAKSQGVVLTRYETWMFDRHHAANLLKEEFKLASLEGLGLAEYSVGVSAAGIIIQFLQDNLHQSRGHIKRPAPYSSEKYMVLDRKSQRNLEIVDSLSGDRKAMTLFKVVNKTVTSMGSRLLREWIKQPLIIRDLITARLDAVEETIRHQASLSDIREIMGTIRDFERILGRLGTGVGSARDLVALKESLKDVPRVKSMTEQFQSVFIEGQRKNLHQLDDLVDLIDRAIVSDPPLNTKEGRMIRPGYCEELDGLRQIAGDVKNWLTHLQERETKSTGIKSLKVRFNKVFGYYIEVTKANLAQVPEHYIRRQTLVNAERFTIPELREYEEKILGAEERASEIEEEIFEEIREEIMRYVAEIQEIAEAIAVLDVLISFALLAVECRYVRPVITDGCEIRITAGRHPVVERVLEEGKFVENDTCLNRVDHQLLIVTGPNMAGKSTYLRQVALIVLMAQIGSFVPAASAEIGVVDKIFTRIGASDNLAQGESTFMVEMIETAHILNNASARSLIILDEIGRGTSTFDGVSIAWAVGEYLGRASGPRPKALFATHFHELTRLEQMLEGAKNFNVMVKEYDDDVVFIRKIAPGGADRSYGIHVGKLAGLPEEVVARAREILATLENGAGKELPAIPRIEIRGGEDSWPHPIISLSDKVSERISAETMSKESISGAHVQEHPLIREIRELDIENLTPLESINRLHSLKEKAKKVRLCEQPIPIHQYRKQS